MTSTFHTTLTNVAGGPCPGCGRWGELLEQYGTYGPEGVRHLVHTCSSGDAVDGDIVLCTVPTKDGIVHIIDAVWWYETRS